MGGRLTVRFTAAAPIANGDWRGVLGDGRSFASCARATFAARGTVALNASKGFRGELDSDEGKEREGRAKLKGARRKAEGGSSGSSSRGSGSSSGSGGGGERSDRRHRQAGTRWGRSRVSVSPCHLMGLRERRGERAAPGDARRAHTREGASFQFHDARRALCVTRGPIRGKFSAVNQPP